MDYMQGNSNQQAQGGLEGLGVINTNNSSATINATINNSVVNDERKIIIDENRFSSDYDWYDYLYKYMQSTNLVGLLPVSDMAKQQLNTEAVFYANLDTLQCSAVNENCFCIFACLRIESVRSLIELLSGSNITELPSKKVAIGYFNIDKETSDKAKNIGLELVGYDKIYDLNNAIDSGLNKMPYMHLGAATFETRLAKLLNAKYKETATDNVGSQFSSQAAGIGAGLGAAFSEGFGQLKQSLFGFGKELGIIKDKQPNQQSMEQQMPQQPMQNMEQQMPQQPMNVEAHHEVPNQINEQPSGVLLDKTEHSAVSLDKSESNGISLTK